LWNGPESPFRNRLFGLCHKNVELLWNGPESPFLTRVQHLRLNRFIPSYHAV